MADPDGLTAALMQLSQQKADIARLDDREAADVSEIKDRIAELMTLVRSVKGTVADQAEILAGVMMLEYLGFGDAAARLETAVRKVYAAGRTLTPDQGGKAGTAEFARAVSANL